MFAEGKIEYILADAMKDGYLRDGDKFTIVMNENDVQFAGVKMTKEHEAQYNDKYRLYKEYYGCPDCHGGVTATLRRSDLTNQNSVLREGDFLLTVNSNMRQEKTMQLIEEMHEEGLIDKNYKVEIFYVGKFFTVNGTMLTGSESAEYIKLIKQYGLSSKNTKNEETWSILLNHDKPYPPGTLGIQAEIEKIKKVVLQEISDELFNKGLVDYIMVDAVKDGYLKDGERYHIEYKDGVVTIKEKTLSINDQIAYNKKLETFTRQFESKGWYGNTRSTVKMSDILDPESGLRTKGKDDAMIAHDKAMEEHDRLMEEHDRLMKAYDRDMAEYDKQNAEYEKERLNEMSEELFRNGHQGFIIAELVKDGYIKKGEKYKVSYKNGKFSMEGKSLPADAIKTYEAKMGKFTAAHPSTATVWWSVEDTYEATNTADEFNLKLGGGTPSDYEKEQKEKEREANFWKFMQALHKDGLLDTNSYYLVEYKEDGLYVNAIKLTGGKAKRYTEWLHALGYTAAKGMLTERVPDGVKIPDRRVGISTVSIPVHGNNLPAIAQLMFVDGNPNFILAHALHDKVIREGQRYDIRYVRGKVYSRGELIAEPYQSRYARLITDFTQAHNKHAGSYAVHGDGVTKEELNTPESAIRRDVIRKGQGVNIGK
ncbi:MAG: hypothetical protein H3C54_08750 [Taibaiella sp.]|nr:hypothetical protein [Taibaiella sp.]